MPDREWTYDELNRLVLTHFTTPHIVDGYVRRAVEGLRPWESAVAAKYLRPGRLLNIGCGAGREAFPLAESGHTVVGIDPSPDMVSAARAATAASDRSTTFHAACADRLPFADASFDHVIAWAQVFGYILSEDARLSALREARRVLRPGGRFIFSVHDLDRTRAIAQRNGNVISDLGAGDFVCEDGPPSYFHFYTRPEIHDLCARAAFDVLDCRPASDYDDPDRTNLWITVCERNS